MLSGHGSGGSQAQTKAIYLPARHAKHHFLSCEGVVLLGFGHHRAIDSEHGIAKIV